MPPRMKKSAALVVVLALVVTVAVVVRSRSNDGAGASSPDVPIHLRAFYLDMGASASLGMQPDGVPHRNGHRTKKGYSDDLVALEAHKGVALTMDEIGCPGETPQSMILADDKCVLEPHQQMATAVLFLHAHEDDAGVVTIDLGFNNVRVCLQGLTVDQTCLAQGLAKVRTYMPRVLTTLRQAAGPHVKFVGLIYADPFLGNFFVAGAGPAEAQTTLTAMSSLNRLLIQQYAAAKMSVAGVPPAFESSNTSLVAMTGQASKVPANVYYACKFTWWCTAPPYGPDDHPNTGGYRIIAKAIAAKLPSNW